MDTLYNLLTQKFKSHNPRNTYQYAEFDNGTVKHILSGVIGTQNSGIITEVTVKSYDDSFEVPKQGCRLQITKSIVALIYKPVSKDVKDGTNVDYRTRISTSAMNDWVRKVDEEVTQGKRYATFTYELGKFIYSFNNSEGKIHLMTTHDKHFSQIEEILQKKSKVSSK
jgi:hypothetical protein